jgi:hypothetical protein
MQMLISCSGNVRFVMFFAMQISFVSGREAAENESEFRMRNQAAELSIVEHRIVYE